MTLLLKELAGVVLPQDAFGSYLGENGVTVDAEKEVQNFKKADFKFIYFVGFISALKMFSVTYHLNDISDVALPCSKTFMPCINSLKTGMSTGDCGSFLISKSISATHWKLMSTYKGMTSSFSSHLSKAASLECQINISPA